MVKRKNHAKYVKEILVLLKEMEGEFSSVLSVKNKIWILVKKIEEDIVANCLIKNHEIQN